MSSGVQRQEASCLGLVSPGSVVTGVGGMWPCCGLKSHPAESPAFSCLTLNFSGKLY